jgi:hypothetical protein
MSYLLIPADHRLKQLAFDIERERRHAIDLAPDMEVDLEQLDAERPERSEPGESFVALSSTAAELDDAILADTTMQLFATDDIEVGPETVSAVTGLKVPGARRQPGTTSGATSKPRKSSPTRGGADGSVNTTAEPKRESAYAARERLRAERRTMVADVARLTGETHQMVNARMNRETGAPSVSKATREQLEKANAVLLAELSRRPG